MKTKPEVPWQGNIQAVIQTVKLQFNLDYTIYISLCSSSLSSLHNPVARAARARAGRFTVRATQCEQASRAAREGLYWFSKAKVVRFTLSSWEFCLRQNAQRAALRGVRQARQRLANYRAARILS